MPPASGADDAAPPPSTALAHGDQPGSPRSPGPPRSLSPPHSTSPASRPGPASSPSPASRSTPPSSPSSPPGSPGPADPVLSAERDHLRRSREFLRLMREDVLGLDAMAADRVSQEYLKADL